LEVRAYEMACFLGPGPSDGKTKELLGLVALPVLRCATASPTIGSGQAQRTGLRAKVTDALSVALVRAAPLRPRTFVAYLPE
jgi:hypothetical protein